MITSSVADGVRLVRAPNPSPLTLDGTNTYVVGDGVVIDPGPADRDHLERVLAEAGSVRTIVLTHRHPDHAEGVPAFVEMTGAPVVAFGGAPVAGVTPRPLDDDDAIDAGGIELRAVHTPGHAGDHLSFWSESTRVLFTGDHVLGRGTSVIAWPDGDLRSYLASLSRARSFGAARLLPGHGPVVDDPAAVIDGYIAHRHEREAQVLAAIDAGDASISAMVERIYADVDRSLHGAAALSVRAHLDKLLADGTVTGSEEVGWQRS